jgi:hypothetical protein
VRAPVGSPGPRCRNSRRWPLPVRVPGKGLVLQEQGKTSGSMRTVALPPWLVSRLLERQVNAVPNEWDVVFCSADGEAAGHVEHHQARTGTAGRSGLYLGCGADLPQDSGDLDGRGPDTTPGEVANQLGHNRAGMTMDRYMFRKTVSATRIP